MSRIARIPVPIPAGVEVSLAENSVSVKGSRGNLHMQTHSLVRIRQEESTLHVEAAPDSAGHREQNALLGTTRALLYNMVHGVSKGFEKRLLLNGVGYRAALSGKTLRFTLGLSHAIEYTVSDDVSVELPAQTEIVLRSADKQLLGQTAAEIRSFRPPEPYKGKGIRYADEQLQLKEAKKK